MRAGAINPASTGLGPEMIEITDINGRRHFLAPSAIAIVSEAGTSGKWHGINSYVRTFDGRVIEANEGPEEISAAVRNQQNPTEED